MEKRPTAIIMQGGAMRGAFAAGVLYEFGSRGFYPDVIAAASSSVPTAAYYVAHQIEDMRAIWTKEVTTDRFIRYDNMLLGKPIYDIDFLINTIFKKKRPLSLNAMRASRTRMVVPLYNYVVKRLESRTSVDPEFIDHMWEYLHLAMIIHDQHILRGTPFEPYVDGALDPFALYKLPIIPKGARVVVIWNEPKFNMHTIKYLGQKLFVLFQARNFPAEVRRMLKTRKKLIEEGVAIYNGFCKLYSPVVIKPNSIFFAGMDVVSRGEAHLSGLLEEGRQKACAAIDSGILKDFL